MNQKIFELFFLSLPPIQERIHVMKQGRVTKQGMMERNEYEKEFLRHSRIGDSSSGCYECKFVLKRTWYV